MLHKLDSKSKGENPCQRKHILSNQKEGSTIWPSFLTPTGLGELVSFLANECRHIKIVGP
jgi:hypothetical protein